MNKIYNDKYPKEINYLNKKMSLVGHWNDLASYYDDGEYYWSVGGISSSLREFVNLGTELNHVRGWLLDGTPIYKKGIK